MHPVFHPRLVLVGFFSCRFPNTLWTEREEKASAISVSDLSENFPDTWDISRKKEVVDAP